MNIYSPTTKMKKIWPYATFQGKIPYYIFLYWLNSFTFTIHTVGSLGQGHCIVKVIIFLNTQCKFVSCIYAYERNIAISRILEEILAQFPYIVYVVWFWFWLLSFAFAYSLALSAMYLYNTVCFHDDKLHCFLKLKTHPRDSILG